MTLAHRLVFPAPRFVRLEEIDLPPLRDGGLLTRSLFSLMSTGTEGIAFLRDFADGTHWDRFVRYPFAPGYATAALVEEVGKGVRDVAPGDVVFHAGAHASHHVLPARRAVVVPGTVAPASVPWCASARIAFVGVRTAGIALGDEVAVIGGGPIGQMAVRWASVAGAAHITMVDPVAARLDHALAGGATATFAGPVSEWPGESPIVIDATGHAAVFEAALGKVSFRGKLVLLGDTGSPARQRLTPDVITKGLTVVGVHAAHLAAVFGGPAVPPFAANDPDAAEAAGRAFDDAARRVGHHFFELVLDGRFPVDGLVSHRFAPEEAETAYQLAAERRAETMGILFEWP